METPNERLILIVYSLSDFVLHNVPVHDRVFLPDKRFPFRRHVHDHVVDHSQFRMGNDEHAGVENDRRANVSRMFERRP